MPLSDRILTLNNLATLRQLEGEGKRAIECLEQALDLIMDSADCLSESPTPSNENNATEIKIEVATTHLNMCALLSSKQEHKDALSHAEKGAEMCQGIVAGFERNGSTASPLYLRACTLMGVSYHNLGVQLEILQDKSACAWYDKAADVAKKVLPVDDSMRIHIVRAAQRRLLPGIRTASLKTS